MTKAEAAQIATIYRRAVKEGRPPVAAVAGALAVSHSTARGRVDAARKAGMLGATRRGAAPHFANARCPTCGASPSRWRRR